MTLPLLASVTRWYCPNCRKQDVTTEKGPHTRFHACPRLCGLMAPMLPVGTKAKVYAVEREDYVGREAVQLDPERRRPIQTVVTVRDDGQDAIMFAPAARLDVRSD